MPARKSIVALVMFSFIFAANAIGQSTRTAGAADECLAKPNAPAPRGQHWYYRVDHQNNNRQCWRLGPEGLRVQKPESQVQKPKPQAAAQSEAPVRLRPATTGMASAPAAASPDAAVNAMAAAAPQETPKFMDLSIASLVPQLPSTESTPSTNASDATPAVRNVLVASAGDPPALAADPVQEPQRADPPTPLAAGPIAKNVDHTFALIVATLLFLVIAGPTLHFMEWWRRRRQREGRNFQPPLWAPLVPSNTESAKPSTSLAKSPASDSEIEKRPVPAPLGTSEQTERVAHALQELLDRLQLDMTNEGIHSGRRPEIGMTRSTR
jgi:hypothetical protein